MGQNPGTNHPRMLSALEKAKRNGARIIAINPLREAGLVRFKNPQKARGLAGPGTELADLHLPVRINGDLALLQALGLPPPGVGRDRPRLRRAPHPRLRGVGRPHPGPRLGRRRPRPRASTASRSGRRPRCCAAPPRRSSAGRWGSPSTGTRSPPSRRSPTWRSSRATSASPAPGCARCAATPTSRATGRWGSGSGCPTTSSTRCSGEFGFDPPREHGFDTVNAVKALRDGERDGLLRAWAATSSPRSPTPRSPRRRCGGPTSPSTSRPSSTAPTSSTAARR